MRCLVTGGAGFIGSHLTDRLVHDGHTVTVLDNLATGLLSNLTLVHDHIQFINGDLRDFKTVSDAVKNQDVVFHLGALGSVPRSIDDPITTNAVNVNGTLNILVAAKDNSVKRVIYASSSSVYGDTAILPKVETMQMNPLSPYSISKMTAETYSKIFYSVYGLETVNLRYFNVFGPRQRLDSQYAAVIPRFIASLLKGQAPIVHGDGLQSRDFTFVQNNVEANILAAIAPSQKVAGQTFNIACGNQHSLLELIGLIQTSFGSSIEPVFVASRAGDVRDSRADIRAAQNAFGYFPKVGFAEGMADTIRAFQATFDKLD
jgi:UDP-glucose 4-epimerase